MGTVTLGTIDNAYKVTVLIGNGFDLGLGLKTRYRDFIDWYLEQSSSNDIIRALKEEIRKDDNRDRRTWASAEMAFANIEFAKIAEKVNCETEDVYIDCAEDITEKFKRYLQQQDDSFVNVEQLRCRDLLLEKLIEITKKNANVNLNNRQIAFRFIDFNYTSTLSKILGVKDALISKQVDLQSNINCRVDCIVHIHGCLSNGKLVFGINDLYQISDSVLRDAAQDGGYLIMREQDQIAGHQCYPFVEERIMYSDLLISLGLSFGESDAGIWAFIAKEFKRRGNLRMIVCSYSEYAKPDMGIATLQRIVKGERVRFFKSIQERDITFVSKDYWNCIIVNEVKVDEEPDGEMVLCDPLALKWIGKQCMRQDKM